MWRSLGWGRDKVILLMIAGGERERWVETFKYGPPSHLPVGHLRPSARGTWLFSTSTRYGDCVWLLRTAHNTSTDACFGRLAVKRARPISVDAASMEESRTRPAGPARAAGPVKAALPAGAASWGRKAHPETDNHRPLPLRLPYLAFVFVCVCVVLALLEYCRMALPTIDTTKTTQPHFDPAAGERATDALSPPPSVASRQTAAVSTTTTGVAVSETTMAPFRNATAVNGTTVHSVVWERDGHRDTRATSWRVRRRQNIIGRTRRQLAPEAGLPPPESQAVPRQRADDYAGSSCVDLDARPRSPANSGPTRSRRPRQVC